PRAAEVTEKDGRPGPPPRLGPKKGHQLAAGADRVPRRAAQVDAARARGTQPARAPLGHPPRRLLEQAPHLLGLRPCHLVEILVPKKLLRAVAARARRELGRVLLPVHLRGVEAKGIRPDLRPLR